MFVIQGLQHQYDQQTVLDIPDLSAARGDHWLILGVSGSGKTTLLHILAGLLRPTAGSVSVAGKEITALSGAALDRFRGGHIGIIFQRIHLLPTLTVKENLLMAAYLAGKPQQHQRVMEVLESLNLADRIDAYPHQLSFGQQQRVAIARAVMNNPQVILADEPTAALDDVNCEQVVNLLLDQAARYNATLVIATHDQRIKPRFAQRIELSDQGTDIRSDGGQ